MPPWRQPFAITKYAIKLEWIKIIQFCLKICDPWTLLHTYRLCLMCRWGVSYPKWHFYVFDPEKCSCYPPIKNIVYTNTHCQCHLDVVHTCIHHLLVISNTPCILYYVQFSFCTLSPHAHCQCDLYIVDRCICYVHLIFTSVIYICTCHPHIILAYAYYTHTPYSGPWYYPS